MKVCWLIPLLEGWSIGEILQRPNCSIPKVWTRGQR